jgi:hypothetical protein
MATQNSINLVATPNADGFLIGGGTTERDLTVTAGNVTLTGGGAAVITFPSSTSTLATLTLAQTFTAAQNMSAGLVGSATNDSAAAGNIGEYISANASAVSLTSATPKTVISISLTAGDWDVDGNLAFIAAATTIPTLFIGGINLTNNVLPTSPAQGMFELDVTTTTAGTTIQPTGRVRVSLATTTTVYLVAQATFTISTMTANGIISARRMR